MLRRFFVFSLFLIALAVSALAQDHAGGKIMSAGEYATFLQRVDETAIKWTAYYRKIDAAKLTISYAEGQKIMQYRDLDLNQLSLLRQYVARERVRPRLWRQIAMATMIQSISGGYADLLGMLPPDSVPSDWNDTFFKMTPEASELSISLLNHVQKRADQLEP